MDVVINFINGEAVQFRKAGGWSGELGEWQNGLFEGESLRCFFIRDTVGEVNEYWKHRIEIRKLTTA